jgi:excisionase family DNA binding protein
MAVKLLTPEQAAEQLSIQAQTLAVWRVTKRYDLPFIKVGRAVRYSPDAIAEFLESRTVSPGSVE